MSNILRPDVAILSETGVIFALEVRVEHPVSPDKALRFKNTPFMEILGEAVLQDPYTWVAIEHNLSLDKDFRCQKCARHNYLLLRQKQPDAKHIPTQLDLAQYDGLYKHIMWEQVRAIPNWQCPVCSRTLLEITTWSYRKNLGREDWLVPIASFPRQTTLICQSCKDADSDVKGKTTNQIPTHFHFTYEQIRQFIVPQPHAKSHILVYNKALEIYQKTLPAPDSVSERRLSEPALSWVR